MEQNKKSFEDFEALKKDFLKTDLLLYAGKASSEEERAMNARLRNLAQDIASIFGGEEWIWIMASAIETEMAQPSESLKNLLKDANIQMLAEEYKACHFAMMTALDESVGERLDLRMRQVAKELSIRMGGADFVRRLSEVLDRESKENKIE